MQTVLYVTPWALILISAATALLALATGVYQYYKSKFEKVTPEHERTYGRVEDVAFLISSKDGEKTIGRTVRAAVANGHHVYVVSDGSTDSTADVARAAGAEVLALTENIGKPSALHAAYGHFKLSERYDAIAILDDDVTISNDFMIQTKKAMKHDVAISVGRNVTEWPDAQRWNMWVAARAYSYWCYQITLRRLQSAYNVMNCISGSNSLYRTEVLDLVLTGQTPYIVDDTFWTLEAHRLKLGKIVYAPKAEALIQDPTNFRDWYKQNLRWMWGTFQGIIGHRIGTEFTRFHMAYVVLIAEWVMYVASGPIAIALIWHAGLAHLPQELGLLIAGYSVWVIAAALALKRPRLLFFIPVIVFIDFVFRALMVHALVKAFRQKTVESCVWSSPTRFDTRTPDSPAQV
jgi:biofilm PGA synthesis N-glycosyltransferase PgaC